MTKAELIEKVAEQGLSKKDATVAVDAVLQGIVDTLINGDDVTLKGIGAFKVVESAERQGVNPKTGEKLTIPAKKRVKFKASKTLVSQLQ